MLSERLKPLYSTMSTNIFFRYKSKQTLAEIWRCNHKICASKQDRLNKFVDYSKSNLTLSLPVLL